MICTDENIPEGQPPVNDVAQMDATYLAINLSYLTDSQQKRF